LRPNSPIIDAGDPTTINDVGFDGYVPQRADIGAFEMELFLEPSDNYFQEASGQVVIEAEHFTTQNRHLERTWLVETSQTGYTGSGYVSALPDIDLQFTDNAIPISPRLNYAFEVVTPGIYYIWLRGYAPNGAGDSLYISLDQQPETLLTGFAPRIWSWANVTSNGTPVAIEITEPGFHSLSLWQREDGLRLDRILLMTNSGYTPSGNGPPESDRVN
jgi:hypothetical protein